MAKAHPQMTHREATPIASTAPLMAAVISMLPGAPTGGREAMMKLPIEKLATRLTHHRTMNINSVMAILNMECAHATMPTISDSVPSYLSPKRVGVLSSVLNGQQQHSEVALGSRGRDATSTTGRVAAGGHAPWVVGSSGC